MRKQAAINTIWKFNWTRKNRSTGTIHKLTLFFSLFLSILLPYSSPLAYSRETKGGVEEEEEKERRLY